MGPQSTAYQIGYAAGIVASLVMLVGIFVLFVFALVKAVTTRRKLWIIISAISGLPALVLVVVFLVGVVRGVEQGIAQSRELAAARRGEPSKLLTAPMSRVAGNGMDYQISLPSADAWTKNDGHSPFDHLFIYQDAYLGVIAEHIGSGTPEKVCEFSRHHLASEATAVTMTTPVTTHIDSHSWLTYDATATVRGIQIEYRFYVYADSQRTVQIIAWTGPAIFQRDAPVFDRIARSFKLPH